MASEDCWRTYAGPPEGEAFCLVTAFPERPGLWDLAAGGAPVAHWLEILRENARYLLQLLAPQEVERGRRVVAIFDRLLDDLAAGEGFDLIRTVHDLTCVRERLLTAHDLSDPYAEIKAEQARALLPAAAEAIEEAWATDDRAMIIRLLARLLAGNLFDLGSRATQNAFRRGEMDTFAATERLVPAVTVLYDRLPEEARTLLLGGGRDRALLFADNAGPDFLLGILPTAVFLAHHRPVTILVNSRPASSDITLPEARAHLAALRGMAPESFGRLLAEERITLVGTGTGSPGIDLRAVAPELNRAAADAGWILLDGQGRGIETNWTTRFRVPVLRVAMVKDPLVAAAIDHPASAPLLKYTAADSGKS